MDNGFTFDGLHSLADMGVIAIKDKKRTVASPGQLYSYEAGGMPGDMVFGDDAKLSAYSQTVRLYASGDLPTETAANAKWREIVSWLIAGRRSLIWDSDPGMQIDAEVTEFSAETSGWVDEGLKVVFRCQPIMRSVTPWRRTVRIEDGDIHTVPATLDTMLPAPVDITVDVLGPAPVTGLVIKAGDGVVAAIGLPLQVGDTLYIRMERPSGAEILRADGTSVSALRYFHAFGCILAGRGEQISISMIMEGAGAAGVTMVARGVYR